MLCITSFSSVDDFVHRGAKFSRSQKLAADARPAAQLLDLAIQQEQMGTY